MDDLELRVTIFYGALGIQIVNAVERKESIESALPTIGAIVEYAAVALEREFKQWAPRLDEFFEALMVRPEANAHFSRFASDRISRRRRPNRLRVGAQQPKSFDAVRPVTPCRARPS